jgi:hypothetical protein
MPNQHSREDREPSRSQRALWAVRSQVQPGSFPLLLVALLLLYVLNGLAVDSITGAILVQVGRAGLACASIYVLSANRVTLWLGVLVVGVLPHHPNVGGTGTLTPRPRSEMVRDGRAIRYTLCRGGRGRYWRR